jgi:hypothetical protein
VVVCNFGHVGPVGLRKTCVLLLQAVYSPSRNDPVEKNSDFRRTCAHFKPAFSPKLAYTLNSASYKFQLWVMNLSHFKLLDSEQSFSGHFNRFTLHMLVQVAFANKLIV